MVAVPPSLKLRRTGAQLVAVALTARRKTKRVAQPINEIPHLRVPSVALRTSLHKLARVF